MAVKGKGYITDDLTAHAVSFLKANAAAGKPSFCYLALNTPHSPMQVPDEYWQRFEKTPLKLTGDKKEDMNHTRAALAMCENIDDNVGRLLAALKDQMLDQNTIVVYFSDNGPNGPRWNGGMKGRKGSSDEGGVRSPLLVRWPAKVKPGTVVTPIAAAVDLYPTLIDLAGVGRVGDKPFDGTSLAPWLLGHDAKPSDRILFQHWSGRVSARDQRYRLDTAGQLFDMVSDPGQRKNVAAEKPEVARRLSDAVDRWKREALGELPKSDTRPFPVGYAEFPRTVLPARDGVAHGGVKRSASAPNCSFFTHWTTADDRMTWQIDVNAAGKFEAIIHYTCPKADVGAALEMTAGDAQWTGAIADARDPPLRGKEHDRVSRGAEAFVNDFRPLPLRVVKLPAGKATLTLRATKVAGAQVADVRAVELVLKR